MQSKRSQIACDALSIWLAGVEAVKARPAVHHAISWEDPYLIIDDEEFLLTPSSRILVVGAGKAAYEMTVGLAEALQQFSLGNRVHGWVNIPGTQAVAPTVLPSITLHPSRPLGHNLPTNEAVFGTERILDLVRTAQPWDLVLCLLSGGGSSLLVNPIDQISLALKIEITQALAHRGADIHQLNTVRRALSNVKGGGLLRACAAEQIATLVISDVLDDDLATIASGPTFEGACVDRSQALALLTDFLGSEHELVKRVAGAFQSVATATAASNQRLPGKHAISILANNATAVDAAGVKAVELGYRYLMHCNRRSEGDAADVGRHMAQSLRTMSRQSLVDCEIVGGEPTVDMQSHSGRPGHGGRNQHLILSAALQLLEETPDMDQYEFCILSGGTDGEDGDTPFAGAWIDHEMIGWMQNRREQLTDALTRFDSNSIFAQLDSLIDCGLTGTNVCDLRIALLRPKN